MYQMCCFQLVPFLCWAKGADTRSQPLIPAQNSTSCSNAIGDINVMMVFCEVILSWTAIRSPDLSKSCHSQLVGTLPEGYINVNFS